MRWIAAVFCFLVALFSCYGFLASGELAGNDQLMWRTGYGLVAALATITGRRLVYGR